MDTLLAAARWRATEISERFRRAGFVVAAAAIGEILTPGSLCTRIWVRLRAGDYRVIYEIVERQLIILVVGAGHRRDVYRNLPS